MLRICLAFFVVITLMLGSMGCNPPAKGAAKSHPVKGVVNLDGKPMAEGEIHFEVTGYPPAVLPIKDGSFAGDAPEGKNKVQILRLEKPKAEKDKPESVGKNTIPAKWNTASTLEATVPGSDFKFDITSK
jgi:hypothetical protein